MNHPLKFHWMLPKSGEVQINGQQTSKEAARYRVEAPGFGHPASIAELNGWSHFAQTAEKVGIDSLLISYSRFEPDNMLAACALGLATEHLKFIIAFRAGLMQPPALVQQLNTLSAMINGRLSVNVVAGSSREEQYSYGDFLSHDDRYARAREYMEICNALWDDDRDIDFSGTHYSIQKGRIYTPWKGPEGDRPEIFVSGHSPPAMELAESQASCWLRVIDTPDKLAPQVTELRAKGIEVCLRLGIICRPTREEALAVIDEILEYTHESGKYAKIPNRDDSQMYREAKNAPENAWLSEHIWAGFKPFYGPVWTTLVGTPDELAPLFMEYKKIGVTQFIIHGWPELEEVRIFGEEVIPRVRAAELLTKTI